MDVEEARIIGARARVIRRRRGLSLDVVAGLAGISKQYLSALERGQRGFNRRGLIEDLADALGCSVADLTGQPYLAPDRATKDAVATLASIRVALNDFGPLDVPDVTPRPLEALTPSSMTTRRCSGSHAGIGPLSSRAWQHGPGRTQCCPKGSMTCNQRCSYPLRTRLAIPSGTYINDFSTYGFDHSGDGVSSVVNNTDEDNTLFSAAGQQGHSLPVDRRSSIANMARIAMAGSPNGTWNDQAQSALAAPFVGNLIVDQAFLSKWQDWETQKWIYSYRLTMHAEETRVVKWALGFGDLPEGTSLSKDFTDVFWGQIVQDGTDGSVLLASPEGGGHTIDPGADLIIDIQVLYPDEDPAHEHLTSLNAQQLG